MENTLIKSSGTWKGSWHISPSYCKSNQRIVDALVNCQEEIAFEAKLTFIIIMATKEGPTIKDAPAIIPMKRKECEFS